MAADAAGAKAALVGVIIEVAGDTGGWGAIEHIRHGVAS